MKIPCKKLRDNAVLPTRGTALAAGVDLYALLPDGQESATVAPQGKYLFPTGVAVEIPEGYVGLVFARSGIATKRQLAPANCVGVIDAETVQQSSSSELAEQSASLILKRFEEKEARFYHLDEKKPAESEESAK